MGQQEFSLISMICCMNINYLHLAFWKQLLVMYSMKTGCFNHFEIIITKFCCNHGDTHQQKKDGKQCHDEIQCLLNFTVYREHDLIVVTSSFFTSVDCKLVINCIYYHQASCTQLQTRNEALAVELNLPAHTLKQSSSN